MPHVNQLPKIAFLIPGLGLGGAELQLVQVIPRLAVYYDVHLVVLSSNRHLLKNAGLRPERVFMFNGKYSYVNLVGLWQGLFQAWQLYRLLQRLQIDTVVAHLPLAHWVGRLAAGIAKLSRFRVKLVTYHHSIYPPTTRFGERILQIIFRFTSRIDTRAIAISRNAADSLCRVLHSKRSQVIYNFVLDDRTERMSPFERAGFQVVVAGRIEPVKGQVSFFQSICNNLTSVDISNNSIHFWFVGDGADLPKLKGMVRDSKWTDLVTFTGAVDHTRMLNFLAHADLVVVPSLQEGLGNVAIEALMFQRTILASDAGGLSEVIVPGQTGFVFSAGDESSLIEQFCRIIDEGLKVSPEIQRDYFESNFTLESHVNNLRQCLNSVLRDG